MGENYPKFWQYLYKIPHETVKDGKVSMMQYEILHYTINCSEKLFECKIKKNALCKKCNLKDDIIHFFIKCRKCKIFWHFYIRWWNSLNILFLDKEKEDTLETIIFGLPPWPEYKEEHLKSFNYVLLMAKYYIYVNKQWDKDDICFFKFKSYLKGKICIEIIVKGKMKKYERYVAVLKEIEEEI